MTISSNEPRKVYNGNDSTVDFTTPVFQVEADLKVYVDEVLQTITTHYTVSGGGGSTGTVSFVTAPATGTANVVIFCDPAMTQGLDLVENDANPAETREAAFDKLTLLVQRLSERVDRALTLADGDGQTDAVLALPSESDRASNFLAFDADGEPIAAAGTTETPVSAAMATVLDDATFDDAIRTIGLLGLVFASKAEAVTHITTYGVENGQSYFITSDDGDQFVGVTGAAPGTYANDSTGGCGTITIPTGGDGSACIQRTGITYVTPEMFGGVGDGTTDCLTALNEAEASGWPIYLVDNKTYYVSAQWDVTTAGTKVSGEGVIKGNSAAAAGSAVIRLAGNNCIVDSITVDQNNIANGNCIIIDGASTTVITRVKSANVQKNFIRLDNTCNDTEITYCVHKERGYGVQVADPATGSGLRILYNHFENTDGAGIGDGIEVNTPTNGFSDVTIIGNTIKDVLGQASSSGIGIGLANVAGGIISGNTVDNSEGDGIHVEDGSTEILILGNRVSNVGVSGSSTVSAGILVTGSSRCEVSSNIVNTCVDCHSIALLNGTGAVLYGNAVVGNTVRIADKAGIIFEGQVGLRVRGNYVNACDLASPGTWAGIESKRILSALDVTSSEISDNVLVDGVSSMAYGIRLDANTRRTLLSSNNVESCSNKILDSGVGTAFSKNRYANINLHGTFTASAGTSTVVNNGNAQNITRIAVRPLTPAAIGISPAGVTGVVAGTSFTVTHGSAGGGEQFAYEIE